MRRLVGRSRRRARCCVRRPSIAATSPPIIPATKTASIRIIPATTGAASARGRGGFPCAADYLVTLPELDRNRLAVVGHSRLGKAAIVAGAFDDRFAVVIPHQAGCGGTAPSRGTVGESVKQINDRFPHWFNAKFKTYNDDTDRLPFDQNALVAPAVPRAVLFTNAADDTWANPEGQFQVLKAAAPVYALLQAGGLDADKMPETGKLIGEHARLRDPPRQTRDDPRRLGLLPRLRRQASRPPGGPLTSKTPESRRLNEISRRDSEIRRQYPKAG